MFYLLVLPFLLSVNSSTSIRAFIQGSLSSSEQQLNLSQLLERQHSPTHLLPAQCRQRVRAGASRIGFCPGCLVKGTWHGLERQQENSKSPVRKHLLVAGNSAAFLRCSVLARGREERAGFSWEGRARVLRAGAGRRWGVQWAADSWSTEAGIFLAPLRSFAIRLCCGLPVVVCSQHRAGSTRACCFPSAADKKLCLHPPERCNHPVLGLFHAPLPREGLQSQPGTLRTERVLERAGPRGA